jgi:hypothetical protein
MKAPCSWLQGASICGKEVNLSATSSAFLVITILFFIASLITEIIFNLIVFPGKGKAEAQTNRAMELDTNPLNELYKTNRPMILRRIPVLSSLVESGGTVFFVMFAASFLITVYLKYHSIAWTLLCVPGLVFLFFISNLLSILLSTLLVQSVHEGDENGDKRNEK